MRGRKGVEGEGFGAGVWGVAGEGKGKDGSRAAARLRPSGNKPVKRKRR